MEFVKTHWISLASGALGLAFVAVAVLGMMSTGVVEEMEKRKGSAGELKSIEPRNEEVIRAEKARAEQFQAEYDKALNFTQQINARNPLMDGVFPKPAQGLTTAFEFKDKYKKEIRALQTRLQGGDLPSQEEIQDAAERIAERKAREAETKAEGETAPPISEQESVVSPGASGPGMRGMGRGGGTAGAGSSDNPLDRPEVFARILKARSIRTYASADLQRPSFHVSPLATADAAPTAEEMWYAQVSLWIQQDIVEAVAALNDAAAKRIKGDVNIENMPVKRIEKIDVSGYLTDKGPVEFVSGTGGSSGGAPLPASFTKKTSDERFDVVRFTMIAIVDQREVLNLVDQICMKNFYQLISLDQATAVSEEGYLYGSAPIVKVTLNFEGYQSRKVFEPMMPDAVREKLGIGKKEEK